MKGKSSVLSSKYIIDGVRYNVSPEEMLEAAKGEDFHPDHEELEPIVDETSDSSPVNSTFSQQDVNKYLSAILGASVKSDVPSGFSEVYTKWTLAKALIDSLWCSGKFRLEDLSVDLLWQWEDSAMGNMAAFYQSVTALTDFIDTLGLSIQHYRFEPYRKCRFSAKAVLSENAIFTDKLSRQDGSASLVEDTTDEDLEKIGEETAFHSGTCSLWDNSPLKPRRITKSSRRKCPKTISGSESSWIIYIPFDTCPFKLGGSMLSRVMDMPMVKGPEIGDADYFIDCFEVIREMVEDGIILGGVTIEEGGLLPSLRKFIGRNIGMTADISGILQSYGEKDIVPVLFGEIPGAIVEISDNDYDYVDAEFLLQDIAYYPLGHINRKKKAIDVAVGDSSSIFGILQSLMNSQDSSEGED